MGRQTGFNLVRSDSALLKGEPPKIFECRKEEVSIGPEQLQKGHRRFFASGQRKFPFAPAAGRRPCLRHEAWQILLILAFAVRVLFFRNSEGGIHVGR